MDTLIVLQQMGVIMILVLIGVFLYKKNILTDTVTQSLSWIMVNICNPALLISMSLSGEITTSHRDFLAGLLFGAMLYAFLCLFGAILPHLIRADKKEAVYYTVITVYTNTGFIGIPLSKAILPANAMIYVIICNIMFSIYFYTHAIYLLSGGTRKFSPKNLINSGIIAAAAAILIYWFHLDLPDIVTSTATHIGNPAVFLSMILVGASLAKQPLLSNLTDRTLWIFIVIRMIAFPVVMTWFLRLIHMQEEAIEAYCIMMAMPAANLPMIQAEKEGKETAFLSKAIVCTTVVSFATVTLVLTVLF